MNKKKWVIGGCILLVISLLSFCDQKKETATNAGSPDSPYLNLHDTVKYVGQEVCRSCHENIHTTFIHTGMGMSFDHATREKSAAIFEKHFSVYDSISNFYYHPFWKGDSLMIMEYRLDGSDTIHKRVEHISYIIGSGHHTNSHMVSFNGYIFQAPITFYTQRGQWDLAPGFEGGFNSRFSRVIQMECMSCHNAVSELAPGSENKFTQIPQGINCERCHGPGELHVKEKLAGKRVDTSKYIDYTIVNPADLSLDLQTDLCQRCHLQGVSVLQDGKEFLDFKPGMKLSEVVNVFLPQYRDKGRFIMASHAERLQLSEAHQMLTCISCHDPHISVKVDQTKLFNSQCQSCHTGIEKDDFHAAELARTTTLYCVSCHMPKSGSIDIPHVSITDHFIHIPGDTTLPGFTAANEEYMGGEFLGLKCMTCDEASPLLMAKGYLRFYESFSPNRQFLDSAAYYLRSSSVSLEERFPVDIHLAYLMNDFGKVVQLAQENEIAAINDPYTLFRIGDAYIATEQIQPAITYLEKAVRVMPLNLEFLNKLGSTYVLSQQLDKGKDIFERIVKENPKYVPALSNLGIIYINLGETSRGVELLETAIRLDPDYEMAYYNLADYYYRRVMKEEARDILRKLIRNQPQNEQAKAMLTKIR